MKKFFSLLTAFLFLAGAGACKAKNKPADSSNPTDADYYSTYAARATVDEQSEDAFTENFNGKINNDLWYLLDGAWHQDQPGHEHNGVRSRNVFLVEEGDECYLAIMGRGKYYKEEGSGNGEELPEGGALISKKSYGPGRYEIKMKAHPREGAVSTMWTYMMQGSEASMQHEIDIEIGGTTKGSQFKNAWFTSWVTHTDKETKAVDVSEDLFLNDGKWHVYTFDWYTEYKGGDPRIDFFIDGKFYASIENNVPDNIMPLWVGVWFPPAWAGSPDFDRDYMYVDYIKHIPFEQYSRNIRYNAAYTQTEPNEANVKVLESAPVAEKISNGGFEYAADSNGTPLGWSLNSISTGDAAIYQAEGGKCLKVTAEGGSTYISQAVTNIYAGYTFNVNYSYNFDNGKGYVMVRAVSLLGKTTTVDLTPEEGEGWQKFTGTFTAPDDCFKLEIYAVCEEGEVLFDDISFVFTGSN